MNAVLESRAPKGHCGPRRVHPNLPSFQTLRSRLLVARPRQRRPERLDGLVDVVPLGVRLQNIQSVSMIVISSAHLKMDKRKEDQHTTLTPIWPMRTYFGAISLCKPPAKMTPLASSFGRRSGPLTPSGR